MKREYFHTLNDAEKFVQGVEYVNDSSLRVVSTKLRKGFEEGEEGEEAPAGKGSAPAGKGAAPAAKGAAPAAGKPGEKAPAAAAPAAEKKPAGKK